MTTTMTETITTTTTSFTKTAVVWVSTENRVGVHLSCHYQDVVGNLEAEALYNALPSIFNTDYLGGNDDEHLFYAAEHPGIMARSMAALFNALGYQTRTA